MHTPHKRFFISLKLIAFLSFNHRMKIVNKSNCSAKHLVYQSMKLLPDVLKCTQICCPVTHWPKLHSSNASKFDWTYLTFKNGYAPRTGCHSMAQSSCHHVHPMRFNQFADFTHFIFFYLNYITQLKLLRKLLRL